MRGRIGMKLCCGSEQLNSYVAVRTGTHREAARRNVDQTLGTKRRFFSAHRYEEHTISLVRHRELSVITVDWPLHIESSSLAVSVISITSVELQWTFVHYLLLSKDLPDVAPLQSSSPRNSLASLVCCHHDKRTPFRIRF